MNQDHFGIFIGAVLTLIIEVLLGLVFFAGYTAHAQAVPCPQLQRNIGLGSQGDDVKALQEFLNEDPVTLIAIAGPGSPGQETTFYGTLTANAVSRFQEKYYSEVMEAAGIRLPTGYTGFYTRAEIAQLCSV